ncbi:MAG: hypothetical protein LWW78_05640 [Deltaproteobacteria bacterium]|nr:hypothetical protein [Deltaproteobacteria bacterium]
MQRVELTYLDKDSGYCEFEYDGINFYVDPRDERFAHSLERPTTVAEIGYIDFENGVIYIKGIRQL